jgi:hypothetical protein
MRLGKLAPAAKGGNSLVGEQAERFEERSLAIITGMIVGHTERIESADQQRHHARVCPEADDLALQRLTHGRDRAFEVADGVVGTLQQACKGGEWITTAADQPAGARRRA